MQDLLGAITAHPKLVELYLSRVLLGSNDSNMPDLKDLVTFSAENLAARLPLWSSLIHAIRHQTNVLRIRLEDEADRSREIRWSRTNATDDFVLDGWTID